MRKDIVLFKNIILIISLLIYFYLTFWQRNQYLFHMTYLKCSIFIILVFLLIYLLGLIINKEKNYKNNINIYIVLYFVMLISVTFIIGRDTLKFYSWWYYAELTPFKTIISELKYGTSISILKNIIGNSVMLMPMSFLLMLKNDKYKNIFKQSLIILPIIGIEVLQAFTHTGSFDIDDIILNYLGSLIFTFLITRFNLIDKIKKLFYIDFNLQKNTKYFLFYLVLFTFILYLFILFGNH